MIPNQYDRLVEAFEHDEKLLNLMKLLVRNNTKFELSNKDIIEENKRLAAENTQLRVDRFKRFNGDECWIYDEHGENHLESLVCPVVIKADVLRNIISNNDKTDIATDEILPCPFCAEVPEIESAEENMGTVFEFQCDCGMASCSVQISDLMTREERHDDQFIGTRYQLVYRERAREYCIKQWNTRVNP
jgi:hypothetical protein